MFDLSSLSFEDLDEDSDEMFTDSISDSLLLLETIISFYLISYWDIFYKK